MTELDHVNCSTPDLAEETARKLAALLPECAGENGEIDIDKLRQCLSSKAVEGNVERYRFEWPGKRAAMAAASAATTKTLRPCREESANFDGTQNLYIEGDNLEALKLLQTGYAGRVKMIYIDPPYNTGHDFVYRDRFSLTQKELDSEAGVFDEDGNRFEVNDSAEARYHSNWCSMMWPRLKLARNLLSDDGVIFISIDDNEVTNLRKLCDEVFGESNFLAECVWEKMYTTKNDASFVSNSHEYMMIYCKSFDECVFGTLDRTAEMDARYTNPDNDPRGPWKAIPLYARGESRNGRYPVKSPVTSQEFFPPPDSHWRYARETLESMLAEHRIWFGKNGDAFPNSKRFLSEIESGVTAKSLWNHEEVGSNDSANKEMRSLFPEADVFSFPKPTSLIRRALKLGSLPDSLVLDFFSGSATTAHAVMALNAEDGGNRKFIMVQLPEVCEPDSEAAKAGYKNICEIGKERIRRAGKKILDEHPEAAGKLDTGFRVLKLDSSSLVDAGRTVGETKQGELALSRIRDDRSPEDLLFQLLLETRIPLSESIATAKVGGNAVFFVGGTGEGAPLVACLDPNAKMDSQFFIDVAKLKPGLAFFRDDAFADDSARTNLQQAFKQFSPTTSVKVI